jgi:hypothetical protein
MSAARAGKMARVDCEVPPGSGGSSFNPTICVRASATRKCRRPPRRKKRLGGRPDCGAATAGMAYRPAEAVRWLLGEADVQDEVPEPEVEYSATSPVHDERQQDDGQNDDHQPEEEHDDAGDCISRYASRSCHGRQLPAAAQLIRPILRREWRLARLPCAGRSSRETGRVICQNYRLTSLACSARRWPGRSSGWSARTRRCARSWSGSWAAGPG